MIRVLIAMLAAVCCPALLAAQSPSGNATPPAPVSVGRIDVTVTAETPVGTSLLPGETLSALDRRDLTQALELVPGVTVRRLGPRYEAGMFLRGFEVRQVPVFIDGFPVSVAYDGHLDLSRFLSRDVEEIRVAKGLASVLYGPNALGGAVNIVTRTPQERFAIDGGLTMGAGGEAAGDLALGSRRGRSWLFGSFERQQADTFPLHDDVPLRAPQLTRDRFNAYRRDSRAGARGGYTATRFNLTAGYAAQRGKKGSPTYVGTDPAVRLRFWRWPQWDKDLAWAVGNVPMGDAGYLRARVWHDTFASVHSMFDDATYTTQRLQSSVNATYDDYSTGSSVEWGAQLPARFSARAVVHVKADVHRELNTNEPLRRFEDRIYSGGGELQWMADRVTVLAAVSADHLDVRQADDVFQGQIRPFETTDTGGVNPQASVTIATHDSGKLYVLASRKTRLPSMRDRFSYRLGQALPNPALEAERSTTGEVGYELTITRRITITAAAFHSRVEDLVQRFFIRPSLFQFRNIGQVAHSGAETAVVWKPHVSLRADLSYTFLRRRNISDSTVPLVDVPAHHAVASAIWQLASGVVVAGVVTAETGRPSQSDSGRIVTVEGFARADAKASWRVLRQVSVEASVHNLTDNRIEVADGFPEPGRTWLAGIRWLFSR